jgi:membrane protein
LKLFQSIKGYFQGLEHKQSSSLNKVERLLKFQGRFWPTVYRRLNQHSAYELSSALSYQTIFALIPVLVLMAVLFKAFGGIEDSKKNLRELLNSAGISQIAVSDGSSTTTSPTTGPGTRSQTINLGDKIEQLVDTIESKITLGSLGPVSVALLIWTALNLLTTMEQALNRIFGAEHNRALPKRIMLYWSTLTLIPLLILVLSYLSQMAMSHSQHVWGISWIILKTTGTVGALILAALLMIGIYKYLPNIHITFHTAVLGAVIAAPLWMTARWGFGLYIQYAATNSFYGAVGVIPVFLLWLYISWLIVLLGAEIAYTAANLDRIRSREEDENLPLGPADLLAGAIIVTRAYMAGETPMDMNKIRNHIALPDITLQRLFDRLSNARIVVQVDHESEVRSFVPARPADQIGILDIFELSTEPEQKAHFDHLICQSIQNIYEQARPVLGKITLADIVSKMEPPK